MGRRQLGQRVALFALAVIVASPAGARLVLTVNCDDDAVDASPGDGRCATSTGRCTLRAAVQEANATPGADEIILPSGSYRLALAGGGEDAAASGDLDLADDVRLTGMGADQSDIDGQGLHGVLQVLPGVTAEITQLTISGGLQPAYGSAGGIYNQGTLHMADCEITGNVAAAPYGTGGLYNEGTATIEHTAFDVNTPSAITNYGTLSLSAVALRFNGPSVGIDNEGALTIVAGDIADQTGSALFIQGETTVIERTHIHDTRPGAAMLIPSGEVTVLDSIIDHNAGGGINNDGGLRVERTILRANSPAPEDVAVTTSGIAGVTPYTGITNTDGATIIDSAILDHLGGGIANEEGGITLINVTVSGNSSVRGGGGICNSGTAEIRSSTITANTSQDGPGGIEAFADSANSVRMSNSIVAGNSALGAAGAPDCSGPITSDGYNLIGNGAGCGQLAAAAGDRIGVDPGLAPLADNGGPTPTHALLPGSMAIDAGNPAPPGISPAACPVTDQRGAGRPQGAACDIGAFETTPNCGNGVLDSGEACDDGNTSAGDCCSPFCTVEPLAGDCNGDGMVDVDELVLAVDLSLGVPVTATCPAADADGDGVLAINDLVVNVRSGLYGCAPPDTTASAEPSADRRPPGRGPVGVVRAIGQLVRSG
jgi:cysteine-rich repeat protein